MRIAAFLLFFLISIATTPVDAVAGSAGVTWTSQSPISLFQEIAEDPASVATGDIDGDGNLDLVIANNRSNDITVLLGDGNGFTFSEDRHAIGGSGPKSVALGDVDNDGALDVVTANSSSNNVSVLLGNGSGVFTTVAGSPFSAGNGPQSVALADIDGDEFLDIVTANAFSDDATVFLSDGGGGFTEAAGSPFVVGDDPRSVALGDLNGDGEMDLVTANRLSDDISFLLGNGSGGFTAAAGSPILVSNDPQSIALGDLDGNGSLDIVTANRFQSFNVSVLLGDGAGGFSAAAGSPIPVGDFPQSIELDDVDRDGTLDIVTADAGSIANPPGVTLLVGNGSGGFTAATGSSFVLDGFPNALALADVDGDENLDAVTANPDSDSVSVLLGDGSDAFAAADFSPLIFGSDPAAIAVGDLDGDGISDAVVGLESRRAVAILQGRGNGRFRELGPLLPVDGKPDSVALGDVNGDSNVDVVVADNNATVLLGNGSGGFSVAAGSPFSVGFNPITVALGDVDSDGSLDLVTANVASADVSVLLGDGAGGFAEAAGSPFMTGNEPGPMALGYIDGDTHLDIVAASYISQNVAVLLGDGNGGVTVPAGSPFPIDGNFPLSIGLGDFDNDGVIDFATSNTNSRDVSVYLGNGSGGFSPAVGSPFEVGFGARSVAVADIDEDGDTDLAIANAGSNNISLLLGDGAGSFASAAGSPFEVGRGPLAVVLHDVDGDGRKDAVVTSDGSFIPGSDESLNVLTSGVLFLDSMEVSSVE